MVRRVCQTNIRRGRSEESLDNPPPPTSPSISSPSCSSVWHIFLRYIEYIEISRLGVRGVKMPRRRPTWWLVPKPLKQTSHFRFGRSSHWLGLCEKQAIYHLGFANPLFSSDGHLDKIYCGHYRPIMWQTFKFVAMMRKQRWGSVSLDVNGKEESKFSNH